MWMWLVKVEVAYLPMGQKRSWSFSGWVNSESIKMGGFVSVSEYCIWAKNAARNRQLTMITFLPAVDRLAAEKGLQVPVSLPPLWLFVLRIGIFSWCRSSVRYSRYFFVAEVLNQIPELQVWHTLLSLVCVEVVVILGHRVMVVDLGPLVEVERVEALAEVLPAAVAQLRQEVEHQLWRLYKEIIDVH